MREHRPLNVSFLLNDNLQPKEIFNVWVRHLLIQSSNSSGFNFHFRLDFYQIQWDFYLEFMLFTATALLIYYYYYYKYIFLVLRFWICIFAYCMYVCMYVWAWCAKTSRKRQSTQTNMSMGEAHPNFPQKSSQHNQVMYHVFIIIILLVAYILSYILKPLWMKCSGVILCHAGIDQKFLFSLFISLIFYHTLIHHIKKLGPILKV